MILKFAIDKTIQRLLIALGIGVALAGVPQLAQAQSVNAAAREAITELDLSFSQMMQLRDVMGDYNTALEDILTPEQLDLINALREEQQATPEGDVSPEDLWVQLDLTEDQMAQLTVAQADLAADVETILTPEQLERAAEMGFLNSF